jgi:hypothetical protein
LLLSNILDGVPFLASFRAARRIESALLAEAEAAADEAKAAEARAAGERWRREALMSVAAVVGGVAAWVGYVFAAGRKWTVVKVVEDDKGQPIRLQARGLAGNLEVLGLAGDSEARKRELSLIVEEEMGGGFGGIVEGEPQAEMQVEPVAMVEAEGTGA